MLRARPPNNISRTHALNMLSNTGGNIRQRTAGGARRRGAGSHPKKFVQKTGHYKGDLGN